MARGNKVFQNRIQPQVSRAPAITYTTDFLIWATIARMTLADNTVVEFDTKYDPETNTIEIDIPSRALDMLNQVTGMQRGPNFKKYIDWLIGSQSIQAASAKDPNFVPTSAIDVWFGAKPTNIEGNKMVLIFPTIDASVIGHNAKVNNTFTGSVKVSLVWMFLGGTNTSFDIRTKATISASDGSLPTTINNDVNISTFNLIKGDVRETLLLQSGNIINPNDIMSILIHRNYVGSPDVQTETIGVVGLKVELINS